MKDSHKEHVFRGRMVMIGFGSVGQGVLPLLLRHIDMKPEQMLIITADNNGRDIAQKYGIPHTVSPLTPDNYVKLLDRRLSQGDLLLNLSVDVSSTALIEFCQNRGILYLDTCIEPWAGGYTNPSFPVWKRTNYALRESALALRKGARKGSTVVITHGANPGLVSHFLKQALINISAATGNTADAPSTREGWAQLSRKLGIRTIHIAERDTQVAAKRKVKDEFVNTWSVDGFISEGCQPAELGWGSHERYFPVDGRTFEFGCKSSIYLMRPGASTRVHTWTPLAEAFNGFLITHSESISIADYLTIGDNEKPQYRPTVHYAYQPCEDAVLSIHELAGRNWQPQTKKRVIKDEIMGGTDELGVLLMGHAKGAYWFGSQLSTQAARELCPHNSATSLQVTAPVLAAVIWALKNPVRGLIEPDEIPFDEILRISYPYLGKVVGTYTDWTPLKNRGLLFEEDLDYEDPWQFKNFRVV